MPRNAAPIVRRVPFVDAVLGGRLDAAAAVLCAAEARHVFRFADLPANAGEDQRDEWYELHLCPFLTETHMALAGGDRFGADWCLAGPAGVDHTPSWRQWGGLVAEWADRHWFPRPGPAARPWSYLDFYMAEYTAGLVEGYAGWRDAVRDVLELKERRPPAT